MSEIQKCPNLVRRGGSTFFKNVWNSKMSQMSEGGEGSTLIGTLSQIFSFFFSDASPKRKYRHMFVILFHILSWPLFSFFFVMALLREGFNKKDMTYLGLRLKLGGGQGGSKDSTLLMVYFLSLKRASNWLEIFPHHIKGPKFWGGEGSAEVQQKGKVFRSAQT